MTGAPSKHRPGMLYTDKAVQNGTALKMLLGPSPRPSGELGHFLTPQKKSTTVLYLKTYPNAMRKLGLD